MIDTAAILSEQGIRLRSYEPGNQKIPCPRCSEQRRKKGDPCLSVTIEPDGRAVWKCHHCGWSGGIPHNGHKMESRQTVRPKPPRVMDTGRWLFEWFAKRGISREIVEALEIYGQGQEDRREIVFPYRHHGELVNNKYRGLQKRFRQDKGAERTFFNIDSVGQEETVVIAEGEIDVLSLLEAGLEPVITLPDGAPATANEKGNQRYEPLRTCEAELAHVQKFVLAKDADAPGGYLADELARRLGRDRCWLVDWPAGCKDANEVLVQHGAEALRQFVERARPYPVNGVHLFSDFAAAIDQLYHNGFEETHSTGWPAVDEIIRVPAQRGLLWIVTGVPNSGKSEWVDALAMNLAKANGWRTAFCSFENPPDLHAVKLLEKAAQMPFFEGPTPRMGEGDLANGKAFLAEHFPLIRAEDESPTLDWLFEKMRAVITRYGVRLIVVDPYNELEHRRPDGMTETEYVSQMLSRMRRFADSHGCQVILVAHPAKLRRNADGEWPIPGLYDISGSANFANKADFGVVVHRDTKTERTKIQVRKCRFKHLGKLGEAELEYELPTGCYRPYRPAGLS